MKIIHCADLHLDSPLKFLSGSKAAERRAELAGSFARMADFAEKEGVSAVIIAGDLFDRKKISAAAKNLVRDTVLGHPNINFYYLRGNHDAGDFLSGLGEVPPNLRLFGEDWTFYEEGGVVIAGAEMNGGHGGLCASLKLDPERANIVVLHGQANEAVPKAPEDIDLRELRGRGIDYLALGHIHSYRDGRLDGRGRWCYPGCLEGRGFDECGEHGFVLLNIENGAIKSEFVPFARRRTVELRIDAAGLTGTLGAEAAVRAKNIGGECLVKLVLTGETAPGVEIDLTQLRKDLEDDFYYLETADESRPGIDYDSYAHDASLKGEFVRTVRDRGDLSDGDKARIIRFGIRALAGEEVE